MYYTSFKNNYNNEDKRKHDKSNNKNIITRPKRNHHRRRRCRRSDCCFLLHRNGGYNFLTLSLLSSSSFFLFVFPYSTTIGSIGIFTEAMRLVVQKVKSASVTVEGNVISSIGPGMMTLVGIHEDDTKDDLEYCCKRLLGCKLWENDSGGLWRHGVKQRQLEVLCVSQFTLYGTLSKKNQPDYKLSMKAKPAQILYEEFLTMLQDSYEKDKIKDGMFGAMMDVSLINDGPVTIIIESNPKIPSPTPPQQPTIENETNDDDKKKNDGEG